MLRIVHAFDWNWAGARFGGSTELLEIAQGQADITLADAILQAKQTAPDVEAHPQAVPGEPAPALLEAAGHAAIVVVGNRGHGGFASLLLGSVSQRVATHAPCPVAVVRGRHDATGGPVVVGVDDSPAAQDALGLAVQIAADRGTDVVAIHAFDAPPAPPWIYDVPPTVYDPLERNAAESETLGLCLVPWREKYPKVRIEARVAEGPAARALVGASYAAQLVVVGSRGHGSFTGTLLGSVGLQLLHHADCPVLIARRPPADHGGHLAFVPFAKAGRPCASRPGRGRMDQTWRSEPGRWAVVLANADASTGVAADVSAGVGPYDGIAEMQLAVRRWLDDHRFVPVGPHWEVYYLDPAAQPDPACSRVDLVQPFRPVSLTMRPGSLEPRFRLLPHTADLTVSA